MISSVADCRLTVFQSIALAQEFWIKVSFIVLLVCVFTDMGD